MDILDRKASPLTAEEWTRLDQAVVEAARSTLIGRKMIEILGPLGTGVYAMPYTIFSGQQPAGVDMMGGKGDLVLEADRRETVNFPILYKDFKICWRDVEADRHLGIPLDVSIAAVAAGDVAHQEDQLIFNGNTELGHRGLLGVAGRLTVKMGNWQEAGVPLADTVKAVGALGEAGNYGPYAMAVSPVLYGALVRTYGNTGMLELDQVKALLRGNVYPCSAIAGKKAVVIAAGMHNLNLAIGEDLVTSYAGAENMNHLFRVFETLALLIRREDSICTIE